MVAGSGWVGCLRGQRRIGWVWKRLRGGQASDDRDCASLGRGAQRGLATLTLAGSHVRDVPWVWLMG
jgi:hypothetical protein